MGTKRILFKTLGLVGPASIGDIYIGKALFRPCDSGPELRQLAIRLVACYHACEDVKDPEALISKAKCGVEANRQLLEQVLTLWLQGTDDLVNLPQHLVDKIKDAVGWKP